MLVQKYGTSIDKETKDIKQVYCLKQCINQKILQNIAMTKAGKMFLQYLFRCIASTIMYLSHLRFIVYYEEFLFLLFIDLYCC